jgi:hypothetical protein
MQIIKRLLFVFLMGILVVLFWYVYTQDLRSSSSITVEDKISAANFADSLEENSTKEPNYKAKETEVLNASIEDFEAKLDSNIFRIFKSSQEIFTKKLKHKVSQILVSDLNGNQQPEFWVYGLNSSKKYQFLAFEYVSGHINEVSFPTLKGRQAFGYVGEDSLYFEKNYLVRLVKYANDPYADLANGYRACFYSYGKDQSFILRKTIDLENKAHE